MLSAASTAARSRGPTWLITSAMSAGCSSASSANASTKLSCESRRAMRLTSAHGTKSPLRRGRRRERKPRPKRRARAPELASTPATTRPPSRASSSTSCTRTNTRRRMSSTWLSSTASTRASSSPRIEAGSRSAARHERSKLLGVDVDRGDLLPGGAAAGRRRARRRTPVTTAVSEAQGRPRRATRRSGAPAASTTVMSSSSERASEPGSSSTETSHILSPAGSPAGRGEDTRATARDVNGEALRRPSAYPSRLPSCDTLCPFLPRITTLKEDEVYGSRR